MSVECVHYFWGAVCTISVFPKTISEKCSHFKCVHYKFTHSAQFALEVSLPVWHKSAHLAPLSNIE